VNVYSANAACAAWSSHPLKSTAPLEPSGTRCGVAVPICLCTPTAATLLQCPTPKCNFKHPQPSVISAPLFLLPTRRELPLRLTKYHVIEHRNTMLRRLGGRRLATAATSTRASTRAASRATHTSSLPYAFAFSSQGTTIAAAAAAAHTPAPIPALLVSTDMTVALRHHRISTAVRAQVSAPPMNQ
jgi:hypothetical protein